MSIELIQIGKRPAALPESAAEVFERSKQHEQRLSRLVMFFIAFGLLFMLLPGTFLGVWNLISISNHQQAEAISAPWIQAHGHAQIFGWIGTFILGIGFYSIPKMRGSGKFATGRAWICGVMWVVGVALRWFTNVYLWNWRIALPVSAALELAAFLIFFRAVSQHKKADGGSKQRLDAWIWVVVAGTIGFLGALLMNLGGSVYLSLHGADPAFPHEFDQRFLVMCGWGFLGPFVWGFSAKWLPIFVGLRPVRTRVLGAAVAVNALGVTSAQFGLFPLATVFLLMGSVLAAGALGVFEAGVNPPKTKGVHPTFPYFVRAAYAWLVIAAALGVWASATQNASGIWGASRHALTVGFIAVMVFSIGQRVLPAFSGMRLLFSPRLMFSALLLLSMGCILRVGSEVLAYREIAQWAWSVLPVSAVLELTGVTLFALNLLCTFLRRPAHLENTELRAQWGSSKVATKES